MHFLPKVGVVSCGGEACVEGTLSREATLMVLYGLSPHNTVTICLPLFLAGGGQERMFAQLFPTIAVDGCKKMCAKKAIEKYSGKTTNAIVVTELLKKWGIHSPKSRRSLDEEDMNIAFRIAQEIAKKIDDISTKQSAVALETR